MNRALARLLKRGEVVAPVQVFIDIGHFSHEAYATHFIGKRLRRHEPTRQATDPRAHEDPS